MCVCFEMSFLFSTVYQILVHHVSLIKMGFTFKMSTERVALWRQKHVHKVFKASSVLWAGGELQINAVLERRCSCTKVKHDAGNAASVGKELPRSSVSSANKQVASAPCLLTSCETKLLVVKNGVFFHVVTVSRTTTNARPGCSDDALHRRRLWSSAAPN